MAKYNYSANPSAAAEYLPQQAGLPIDSDGVAANSQLQMRALVHALLGGAAMAVIWSIGHYVIRGYWHRVLFVGWLGLPVSCVFLQSLISNISGLIWQAERMSGRDINNDGWVGEPVEPSTDDVRLIPVSRPQTINGVVTAGDLRYFVRTICQTRDWTQRAWVGKLMPSRLKCTQDYHAELVRPLVDARVIVGYGPRTSGELYGNAEGILRLLGLHERNSSTLLTDSE